MKKRRLWIALSAASAWALWACGDNTASIGSGGTDGGGGTDGNPFDCATLENPPAGCGDDCSGGGDADCPTGTFCLDDVCTAQCTADEGCGSDSECSPAGRCVPKTGTGGTSGTGGTGATGGQTICDSVAVTPTRSIPNVMFLVDASASMDAAFGDDQDRWQAAHSAITSIADDLESIVRFGLTTYTSKNGDQNPPCPRLPTQIGFALGNASAIGDENDFPPDYPGEDGDDTPTGDSIEAVVDAIGENPPPADGPTIIVLATDGLPDSCEFPDPTNNTQRNSARQEAVDAAALAHGAGIDLFVLWVGPLNNQATENHVQDVANAGVGGTDAEFWVGTNPQGLEDAFRAIVGESISCEVGFDAEITEPETACDEGEVRLGGSPLVCGEDWELKPSNDGIELLGQACEDWKSGVLELTAEFPCGSVVVIVD